MIKSKNTNKIIAFFLVFVCILIIFNPLLYANATFTAVSVWATKVFPTLFPFFILTRLIVSLCQFKSNPLDKYFSRMYNAPTGSLTIFLLSALSGYPMGAKLICSMYDSGYIDSTQAKKMMSFTSISGPMFMIATVGIKILNSYTAGLIIMITNIFAVLLNGLIYRGKKKDAQLTIKKTSNENLLSDTVYDSLVSILMVGGFIVFSYLIIEVLYDTKIIQAITNTICCVFKLNNSNDIVSSILTGTIEITRGSIDVSATNLGLAWKTIIISSLISFGGLSIIMQSKSFLSKINMPIHMMIMQKITQMIICFLLSIPICLLLL